MKCAKSNDKWASGQSWGLFLESPGNFSGPKSQLSNCNALVLKSWFFKYVFNVRKIKSIVKFDGLEMDPKSSGKFEKQALGVAAESCTCTSKWSVLFSRAFDVCEPTIGKTTIFRWRHAGGEVNHVTLVSNKLITISLRRRAKRSKRHLRNLIGKWRRRS